MPARLSRAGLAIYSLEYLFSYICLPYYLTFIKYEPYTLNTINGIIKYGYFNE